MKSVKISIGKTDYKATEIISELILYARLTAKLVFPVAVGPNIVINFIFLLIFNFRLII